VDQFECADLLAYKVDCAVTLVTATLVVGELLMCFCSFQDTLWTKPLKEKIVVSLNDMEGSQSINLQVSKIFLDKKVPDHSPPFKCVAMTNGHNQQFVNHLHDIQSISFWSFSVWGCVVELHW